MAYSESDTRSKLIGGKRYFVDYLLTYKNTNFSIIQVESDEKVTVTSIKSSETVPPNSTPNVVNDTKREFILERYKKDDAQEFDEDKLGKLVDLSGLGTVREVANNFGGIPQMRDEYFLLQREIYR